MLRLKKKDIAVLTALAEYRILTIPQITALHFSCKKVARRRLGKMAEGSLIEIVNRGFGRTRGRPESVFSLGQAGIELLWEKAILCGSISNDKVSGDNISCLNHQMTQWST